jgi:homoserine acetyltransferase
MADGLKFVKAEVIVMPSKTDGLVRPEWAAHAVDILRTLGKKAKLHVIDTAFLALIATKEMDISGKIPFDKSREYS